MRSHMRAMNDKGAKVNQYVYARCTGNRNEKKKYAPPFDLCVKFHAVYTCEVSFKWNENKFQFSLFLNFCFSSTNHPIPRPLFSLTLVSYFYFSLFRSFAIIFSHLKNMHWKRADGKCNFNFFFFECVVGVGVCKCVCVLSCTY